MKFWQGNFNEGLDEKVLQFLSSFSFDKRLYKHDIMGSIAHCTMLGEQGLINENEVAALQKALTGIFYDITTGKLTLSEANTVYEFLDNELISRVGEMGEKLNIGRALPDRIELTTRMYVSELIDDVSSDIKELALALIELSNKNLNTVLPIKAFGCKGQPTSLAHVMMSYCERFIRDIERLRDGKSRALTMPLYSQYGTGTRLNINKKKVAELLKFKAVAPNSYDAINDTDYITELLCCCGIVAKHMTALCDELIKLTADGLVKTDGSFNVDSPVVPQTDVQAVLTTIKAKAQKCICMSASALQNLIASTEMVFETEALIKNCAHMLAAIIPSFYIDEQAMLKAVNSGYTTAYDCVEYLISKGIERATAYAITGKLCEYCAENSKRLDTIPLDVYREFSEAFDKDIILVMRPKNAVRMRKHEGEPSDVAVRAEIRNAVKKLSKI